MGDSNEQRKYIAALDIGTTSLRCFIYDNNVQLIGKASDKVSIAHIVILVLRLLQLLNMQ